MLYYLILQWCAGYAAGSCVPIVIPIPYYSEQDCEDAGKAAKGYDHYRCFKRS